MAGAVDFDAATSAAVARTIPILKAAAYLSSPDAVALSIGHVVAEELAPLHQAIDGIAARLSRLES